MDAKICHAFPLKEIDLKKNVKLLNFKIIKLTRKIMKLKIYREPKKNKKNKVLLNCGVCVQIGPSSAEEMGWVLSATGFAQDKPENPQDILGI